MHDSSLNDEIAQEVSCDFLDENMSSENLLYEIIDEESSESKCARNMCIGKCEVEKSKDAKVTQRVRINCTEEDEDVIDKNRKNREYNMKRKRAENSLDENCEATEKKRAYDR